MLGLIRTAEVLKYGWQHAGVVSSSLNCSKSRLYIFVDIVNCYLKYKLWSNQYLKEEFWAKSKLERRNIGNRYKEQNSKIDEWYRKYYENNKFIYKYSSLLYDNSLVKRKKRLKAYTKQYGFGKGAYIESGVQIRIQHFSDSLLQIGEKCHIGRDADIDYTGGLKIGNGVNILEGVKILTHGHDFMGDYEEKDFIPSSNRAFKTPLVIGDNVIIGARCMIMPGVKEIGENSIIAAGSIVTKKVSPNSVVVGNPAKTVLQMEEGMRVYFDYKPIN